MEGSLVLHAPPTRPWGSPNVSPFCTKLECYLRMAGLAYELRPADPRKAPKGKIPYVTLPDGQVIGDSQLIIERFEGQRAQKFDAWLTPDQHALGHVVRRMLDEATYFVLAHLRWDRSKAFEAYVPEFKKLLPRPFQFLLPIIRRDMRKALRAQGTGRHTPAEVDAMGIADLRALSCLMGDKAFLLGDQPSTFDASAFAMIDGILSFPSDSAVISYLAGLTNLCKYRGRMRAKWFSDVAADVPR